MSPVACKKCQSCNAPFSGKANGSPGWNMEPLQSIPVEAVWVQAEAVSSTPNDEGVWMHCFTVQFSHVLADDWWRLSKTMLPSVTLRKLEDEFKIGSELTGTAGLFEAHKILGEMGQLQHVKRMSHNFVNDFVLSYGSDVFLETFFPQNRSTTLRKEDLFFKKFCDGGSDKTIADQIEDIIFEATNERKQLD